MIRMARFGAFKKKCKDFSCVRDTFQKIVNAAHLEWDEDWSPPILNSPRLDKKGERKVSDNTLEPYKLYEESAILSNPIYFTELQRFVLARWKSKYTTDPILIAELMEQQQSKLMTIKQMINHLKWCVQQSSPRFQLCWPSVKY